MSGEDYMYPGVEPAYLLAERIVAGSACVLSILGAFFVIFSFFYDSRSGIKCKEVLCKLCCGYRITEQDDEEEVVTKYKLKSYHFILINLSVADIIVAASHFWGLCSNLENKFLPNITDANWRNISEIASGQDTSCVTQGAFTALSTMASFFWTDILAVFLAFNIVCIQCTNNFITGWSTRRLPAERSIEIPEDDDAPYCCEAPCFLYILFPMIGWGLPIAMTVFFGIEDMLGYTEDYDAGWCYFYLDPTSMTYRQRSLSIALGYEMWLWGSVVIVLLCTFTYSLTVCCRRRTGRNFTTNCTEFRYLSVGIAFALLRLPSTVINMYLISNPEHYKTVLAAVLNICASATISLQGGVNGIIYLCCRSYIKERCCQCRRRNNEYEPLN